MEEKNKKVVEERQDKEEIEKYQESQNSIGNQQQKKEEHEKAETGYSRKRKVSRKILTIEPKNKKNKFILFLINVSTFVLRCSN